MIETIGFWDWAIKKAGSRDKVIGLKRSDKKKLFLRWKWMTADDNLTEQLETTRNYIKKQVDKSNIDTLPDKDHWDKMYRFEDSCHRLLTELGVIRPGDLAVDPVVKKVTEQFSGEVQGWDDEEE